MELYNNQVRLDGGEQKALGIEVDTLPAGLISDLWRAASKRIAERRAQIKEAAAADVTTGVGNAFYHSGCILGPVAQEYARLGDYERRLTGMDHAVLAIDMETTPAPAEVGL